MNIESPHRLFIYFFIHLLANFNTYWLIFFYLLIHLFSQRREFHPYSVLLPDKRKNFKRVISFMKPPLNYIFEITTSLGLKLVICFRLDFSNLKQHKLKRNFLDSVDLFRSCRNSVEITIHFFSHCENFAA